jgi:tetratricopeptide (TPR) repeat protein
MMRAPDLLMACGSPSPRKVVLVATCVTLLCHVANAESNQDRVEAAIAQYSRAMDCQDRDRRLSMFARAEQLFRQVVEGDAEHPPIENAQLFVNLGNAALQAERLGPAILAYRRALAVAPHNAQARQNLAYARALLPQWARYDEQQGLFDSLFFWRSLLSASQIKLLAAGCFLAAGVLVAVGIYRNQGFWKYLAIAPLFAWAIVMSSQMLVRGQSSTQDVVVVLESLVYSADSANAPSRLSKPLPSGTELRLIQQRDRWSELELPDGRTGWVLAANIRSVQPAR